MFTKCSLLKAVNTDIYIRDKKIAGYFSNNKGHSEINPPANHNDRIVLSITSSTLPDKNV